MQEFDVFIQIQPYVNRAANTNNVLKAGLASRLVLPQDWSCLEAGLASRSFSSSPRNCLS